MPRHDAAVAPWDREDGHVHSGYLSTRPPQGHVPKVPGNVRRGIASCASEIPRSWILTRRSTWPSYMHSEKPSAPQRLSVSIIRGGPGSLCWPCHPDQSAHESGQDTGTGGDGRRHFSRQDGNASRIHHHLVQRPRVRVEKQATWFPCSNPAVPSQSFEAGVRWHRPYSHVPEPCK